MAGISEWLGLIGVVLGSALGYASSSIQESLRRRHEDSRLIQSQEREDRIRLENRKFDAYTALSTAANRVHAVAKYPTLAEITVRSGKLLPITDPVAFMGQLNLAYESFDAALSPAFLLAGTDDVHRSLRELTTTTLNLMNGFKSFAGSSEENERLLREQRHALQAMEAAVRREFGLNILAGPGP